MLTVKDKTNDPVFSYATLTLGEIHWYLLKASTLMNAKIHEPNTYKPTEFGNEVGRDEINWWVFKKEENVDELRQRTEQALAAAAGGCHRVRKKELSLWAAESHFLPIMRFMRRMLQRIRR
jgi:hypothetical protein